MTWSDGAPVTAEDILFTLEYEDAGGSANFTPQTDADGKTTEAKYTGYTLSDDKQSISLTLASANPGAEQYDLLPGHAQAHL